jgi:hypothetical protein
MLKKWLGAFILFFYSLTVPAQNDTDDHLPPELQDVGRSAQRDGFVELFGGYNTRAFSTTAASLAYHTKFGFDYYSGNSMYGGARQAEPVYFNSKQNMYFAPQPSVPLAVSSQSVFTTANEPIYRFGMMWKASATEGLRQWFHAIGLSYAVNLQPLQFDAIPGYNWQIEHTYQVNLPVFYFLKGASLRGVVDQDGGSSGVATSYSAKFLVPVAHSLSAYTEYKHSPNQPAENYNGTSVGLEFTLAF